MTVNPPPDNEVTTDFASWLLKQGDGGTEAEMTQSLADLVRRVNETGKKGSLTLIITVGPMKENHDIIAVTDEIKLKLPEHNRKGSLYWSDAAGNLLRNDPNQRSIFDEISQHEVNPTTGEIQD